MRNWLLQLWRLRNPTICHLQAGIQENCNSSLGLKTWVPGVADGVNPSPRVGEDEMRCFSSSRWAGRKGSNSPSSPFCSLSVLNGLKDAWPHWGGTSTSLSPQVQMQAHPETSSQTHPEIIFNLDTSLPSQVDTKNYHCNFYILSLKKNNLVKILVLAM